MYVEGGLVRVKPRNTIRSPYSVLRTLGLRLTAEVSAELNRTDGERRPASTDAERLLQKPWASVIIINSETNSADGNFFGTGGDSLGAIKLAGLARQEGVPSLTVRDVCSNPILHELARVCF